MVYITYFTLKEKKPSYSIYAVFACGNLSTAMFFFCLSRFHNYFFEKCWLLSQNALS